jgi:diacylglycerol kinase
MMVAFIFIAALMRVMLRMLRVRLLEFPISSYAIAKQHQQTFLQHRHLLRAALVMLAARYILLLLCLLMVVCAFLVVRVRVVHSAIARAVVDSRNALHVFRCCKEGKSASSVVFLLTSSCLASSPPRRPSNGENVR